MENLEEKALLLVVDDIEDNLFVLEQLIHSYLPNCHVITAQSAEEGLKIASKTALDGAIIDVQMPGMDGVEMCKFLKAHELTGQIPIILITAHHTTSKIKAMGMEAGADDFLSKPIDNHELIAKIKVMLRIKNAENKLRLLNLHLNDRIQERTKELKESEKRFRDISENALEWIWETDSKNKFTYSNSIVKNILGYSIEETLNKTFHDIININTHTESKDKIFEIHAKRISFRNLLICASGKNEKPVWLLINGIPMLDKENNLIGYRGSCIDISETKEAEEKLKKSEEKFISLSNNIPGMIYRAKTDLSMEIILNCEDICGYFHDDFYTNKITWTDMIYSEDKERILAEINILSNKPLKIVQEYRIVHKDGNIRWIEDHKTSYFREDIFTGIDGVVIDITERKKIISQLVYAQKMEIIGQLSSGLAHDFNNILTVIEGHAYILKKALENNILINNVEHVLTSSKKASDLVSSLLTFSKHRPDDYKIININKIINEIEKILHDIISNKINLKLNLSDKDFFIKADKCQIEQILMNLITNAQHAMPDGGDIIIKTEETTAGDITNEVNSLIKYGKYVIFSVKDNGTGIDPGIQNKIFDPFFTTKKEGKGTGLGLAMVFWITKQHNGFIRIKNNSEKGAEFKIYLPLVESVIN